MRARVGGLPSAAPSGLPGPHAGLARGLWENAGPSFARPSRPGLAVLIWGEGL